MSCYIWIIYCNYAYLVILSCIFHTFSQLSLAFVDHQYYDGKLWRYGAYHRRKWSDRRHRSGWFITRMFYDIVRPDNALSIEITWYVWVYIDIWVRTLKTSKNDRYLCSSHMIESCENVCRATRKNDERRTIIMYNP